ncbi:hypothetical protein B9G99_02495 [Kushneria konosiri]|uniref:Uncharacterized protein n=1 Tax=Kushneria konosiri TaxID=698828 RepID=A0A2Z2HF44_9GAMM|nr:hypothetical protein B9G99_02495 [Kushneria konosiri]
MTQITGFTHALNGFKSMHSVLDYPLTLVALAPATYNARLASAIFQRGLRQRRQTVTDTLRTQARLIDGTRVT